ncbi:MAG: NAD(P)/FAD-dependent oxidoreductase [Cyclobacteriaceae bacterium]|nr:NAD(P)/FAD-dependent oxidoreductase [Cyclobacteriaceae bacterium]
MTRQPSHAPRHFKAIIIGAGPSGIGVAVALSNQGVFPVAIIEREATVGGIPALYKGIKGGIKTFIRWSKGGIPIHGDRYAEWLEKKLSGTRTIVFLQSHVLETNTINKEVTLVNAIEGKVTLTAGAIILACGAREKSMTEKGWITGTRAENLYYGRQIVELESMHQLPPLKKPVILGSDVLAYAIAAKLTKAGARRIVILDETQKPKCTLLERLYFRRWTHPDFLSVRGSNIEVTGDNGASGIMAGDREVSTDAIILGGDLVPNSELAIAGGLEVALPERIPVVSKGFILSQPGWFAAGNILGGSRGAEWCYHNGLKTGKKVAVLLSS